MPRTGAAPDAQELLEATQIKSLRGLAHAMHRADDQPLCYNGAPMKLSRRDMMRGAASLAASAALPLPVTTGQVFRMPTGPPLTVKSGEYVHVRYIMPQLGGKLAEELGQEFERDRCALTGLTDGRFDAVVEG
jgi:hypothetical protein